MGASGAFSCIWSGCAAGAFGDVDGACWAGVVAGCCVRASMGNSKTAANAAIMECRRNLIMFSLCSLRLTLLRPELPPLRIFLLRAGHSPPDSHTLPSADLYRANWAQKSRRRAL